MTGYHGTSHKVYVKTDLVRNCQTIKFPMQAKTHLNRNKQKPPSMCQHVAQVYGLIRDPTPMSKS